MNRKIKFRAWDKEAKIMYPNVQNHIGNFDTAFGNMLRNKQYILMQYTGLKDKNSVEIYEGDKLQESYGDICIVYWKESTAGFHCKWRDGSDMPLDYGVAVNKCKIIGTIHDKEKK